MITTTRDRTFTELLNGRLAQYRCPSCTSFHVKVVRMELIIDGSLGGVIEKGDMECLACGKIARGRHFFVATHSLDTDDHDRIIEAAHALMRETGDEWLDLTRRAVFGPATFPDPTDHDNSVPLFRLNPSARD